MDEIIENAEGEDSEEEEQDAEEDFEAYQQEL